ncbi:hypothetical protein DI43_07370 [Geobacillus sp. CAMR12739]|nr:hypothetical protein DI43_07370 [Geobacillus sp. CAMR12739]
MTLETMAVMPLSAVYLLWVYNETPALVKTAEWWQWALLAGAGPATAVPLLYFAKGAKRVSMTTLGFFAIHFADDQPSPWRRFCSASRLRKRIFMRLAASGRRLFCFPLFKSSKRQGGKNGSEARSRRSSGPRTGRVFFHFCGKYPVFAETSNHFLGF